LEIVVIVSTDDVVIATGTVSITVSSEKVVMVTGTVITEIVVIKSAVQFLGIYWSLGAAMVSL
jgi:hypothetical protein